MTFIIIALFIAAVIYLTSRSVVATVLGGVVYYLFSYFLLPVIAVDFLILLGSTFYIAIVTSFVALNRSNFDGHGGPKPNYGHSYIGTLVSWGVVVVTIATILGSTMSMFNASEYQDLLGDMVVSSYTEDTSPIDLSRIRVVDEEVAYRLADKKLGEDPGLGSRVELGPMFLQEVNGEPYYVAPLVHSGFMRWLNSKEGTPGYVKVSATNQEDVELVTEINGEPLMLRYNTGAYFGDDPQRYLYTSGYQDVGLTDFTFGINDEGRPYYEATTYEHLVGFGGANATGIVLLDVQTGEITKYSLDEVPSWIDRVQPMSMVLDQLRDYGQYIHGWYNSAFGARLDTVVPSEGATIVYGENGTSYLYTGITSAGADESTVGFVLVDLRTKKVRMYEQPGATEAAARQSAMGAVQDDGYYASWPILYNVSGRPTYYMTLKDKGGLIKLHAFVSVENYQLVGVGPSIRSAHRSYRSTLMSSGNSFGPEGSVELQKYEGVVRRIGEEVSSTDVQIFYLLEEVEDHAFVVSADAGAEVIFTNVGDRIRILVEEGGDEVSQIVYFDNLDLRFRQSDQSRSAMERARAVDASQRSARSAETQ